MPLEIERKFLLKNDTWREGATGTDYKQGYLSVDPQRSVRVRLSGQQGWLTVKGASEGIARLEFDYPIPRADAEALLDLCLPTVIEKTRYIIKLGKHRWEIDEFHGANEGLLMAEIELNHADEAFEQPEWLGEEVTHDPRYYNATLSNNPYCRWKTELV
jgi:CYTH domain-containing protein